MTSTQANGAGSDAVQMPSLAERLRGLYTALICDVLDELGHRQSSLGFEVGPLTTGARLVGTAFTMKSEPVDEVPDVPYTDLLSAYSRMSAGDVVVIATDREDNSGIWGELLSIAARRLGVVGVVTDGLVRDIEQIETLEFPVFARGPSPLDSAGRQEVIGVQVPIRIGNCVIHPGDLVVGDRMGMVVIPHAMASEVVALAEERDVGESSVRAALQSGADIVEVFDEFGLL